MAKNSSTNKYVPKSISIVLLIISILLCISLIVGVSYSIYQLDETQKTTNTIQVGCFTIDFEDYGTDTSEYTNISLTNSFPISTERALNETPYTFKITNTCDYIAKTNIAINVLKKSSISQLAINQNKTIGDMVNVAIKEGSNATSTPVTLSSLSKGVIRTGDTETQDSYILRTEYLKKNEPKEYSIWMWVPESINNVEVENEAQSLTLYSKVDVYSVAVDDAMNAEGNYVAYIPNGKESILNDFEITGGTQSSTNVGQDGDFDLVVSGKNLINYAWFPATKSANGITFTNNNNGSITLNGTTQSYDLQLDYYVALNVKKTANFFFTAGNYAFKLHGCNGSEFNSKHEPYLYIRQYYNGGTQSDTFYVDTYKWNNNEKIYEITSEKLSYGDFQLNLGLYNAPTHPFSGTEQLCPQIEYGDEATEFEPYKERRYTIQLKDTSNNTINGLSSNDTLKKVNGIWVIDNGSTQTTLAESTQSALNNIMIYNGVSRVWVDDNVLISHISVDYYEN